MRKFKVISTKNPSIQFINHGVKLNDIVYLVQDDGTHCPFFSTDPEGKNWFVRNYKDLEEVFEDTPVADSRGGGLKYDAGKPQTRLLHEGMPLALARVVDTLTFGAQKYAAHSWQTVPNALERYQDASYRHDAKRTQGEKLDPETSIHHRAHHIVNELFLLELELRAERDNAAA